VILTDDLAASLAPLISRVRTDVTAAKVEGRQMWTRDALTPERLAAHLDDGVARGVSQIPAGGSTTRVAVLDFDSHGGESTWQQMSEAVLRVVDVLEMAHGLRPTLWRSSGGRGVHLYLLWDEGQDAYSVRELLRGVLLSCGLRSGTKGVAAGEVEVFPKQDAVPADGFGNQVVLPLAGASVPLSIEDDLT
jgi:hypothetical protein